MKEKGQEREPKGKKPQRTQRAAAQLGCSVEVGIYRQKNSQPPEVPNLQSFEVCPLGLEAKSRAWVLHCSTQYYSHPFTAPRAEEGLFDASRNVVSGLEKACGG